ncbi:nuclear transport factor 2 family protein [Streptomyces monticola]|uniref:Nuclear transport factor 2 family protein n=1 Tax=Streptomyces monticola TaxID=2666263 RepID=A0ABW2JLL0_9ACTN
MSHPHSDDGAAPPIHSNARALHVLYQDLTRIAAYVADDVVLHPATRAVAPDATDVVGKDAVEAWERALVASTAGTLVMDVQQIAANDHFGTVLDTLEARFHGTPTAQPFCGLWRFEDGRITEHWENIYDPHLLNSLTGEGGHQP